MPQPAQGSASLGAQDVNLPWTAWGFDPQDLVPGRLSCLNLPRDLHPDPGMPSSWVATVLCRINFRKTHP